MKKIAKLSSKDREALFKNTADKVGIPPAIVEKDFWVCYMLDYLFHRSKWREALAFKGGTSLSKAYNIIERFSEDIDLILDWRLLGFETEEPWKKRSNTKQDLFNESANEKAAQFLSTEFIDSIRNNISIELGYKVEFYIDDDDKQTVNFVYPQLFSNPSILQQVRLEIGALAAWTPAKEVEISSFAAEQYPQLFSEAHTSICTVTAERTFWEKVTILHKEANRISGKFPERYSRHYYDLYCMYKTKVKENAFLDTVLLNRVVEFKIKFYRCKWAKYEDAIIGTIKLVPDKQYIPELQEDYTRMCNMMYGDIPEYIEVMEVIQKLEFEINNIKE